ncbi:amidophosphoribosyltransferase [Sphingomonas sp. Root710]|uniref:carboxylesterase/lipase family protein n=1 Tax=Sphingomonas sp. Root710 TaxID=1736594 RepID=UPI0006F53A0E|nr:carboxylesterase family protein [Sphingomonas sp. Root710]KRB82199.1 amidophosphoribosyltransferase [Sphingomonas sp. Root710]
MIDSATTRQGRLTGIATKGGSAFLGIPYAAPPVGDLRWRPPHDPLSWQGTRAADRHSPVAMQFAPAPNSLYNPGSPPQSEDCLTLNVWTDAKARGERRPVMVWFHLGAFMFGSSACTTAPDGKLLFDGSGLAALGAVVVTVNYRLGRMGFLAHPLLSAESEHGASGNYGFMDQVAALRWVRDNIAEFGGDPGNVTIFGVSAGSASCSMHMASPLSKGLFHRAIAGSGAFMGPPAQDSGLFDRPLDLPSAEARGQQLSDGLGATTLDALRALPPEAIMTGAIPMEEGRWYMEALGGYLGEGAADTNYPIVDGYALPDSPGAIIRAGKHNDVPLLTGSTTDDCSGLPSIKTLAEYEAYLRTDMGPLADAALRAYPAVDDRSAARSSGDLLADRVFGWQNWTWANLAQRHGNAPVYYYDWTYAPPIPTGRYLESDFGPVHAAEIPYVFRNLAAYDWAWTAGDETMSGRISRYWVNFAKAGDPNGEGLPSWPQFTGSDGPAMQLGETLAAGEPLRRERFAVLDDYYAPKN